jgi:hypothetical protein
MAETKKEILEWLADFPDDALVGVSEECLGIECRQTLQDGMILFSSFEIGCFPEPEDTE